MKRLKKVSVLIAMTFALATPAVAMKKLSVSASPASAKIVTTPTGYDSSDDVKYVTSGGYVANWGARGEDCVFLSKYAQSFYTGADQYVTLSQKSGGTSQSTAPNSSLYSALQDLMEAPHNYYTYYGSDSLKDLYKYTDCLRSDTSKVSLLYRGGEETGEWNSGSLWNQEHMWPKSKLDTDKEIGDLMHLRPSNPNENSSRGNKPYGEQAGSTYYDPGTSIRGDCARVMLYMYVRWGNTSNMWGSNGVIESLDLLLEWMEEDPVDTWEMGRNDAVQSITGTRNVFVDYPEYAWLLFGEEIPDVVTPSGIAQNDTDTSDSSSSSTPSENSSSSSSSSSSSENSSSSSSSSSSSENSSSGIEVDSSADDSTEGGSSEDVCEHDYSDWFVLKAPTETEIGRQMRTCRKCGSNETELLPKVGETCVHEYCDWFVLSTDPEVHARICQICGATEKKQVLPENENGSEGEGSGCQASVGGSLVGGIVLAAAMAFAIHKKRLNE